MTDWLTHWLTDSKLNHGKHKTARYSGHCHRNLPLGSCLVMRSAAKSDARPREIDLKKVGLVLLGHTDVEISYIGWVSLVRLWTTNPSCVLARPRGTNLVKTVMASARRIMSRFRCSTALKIFGWFLVFCGLQRTSSPASERIKSSNDENVFRVSKFWKSPDANKIKNGKRTVIIGGTFPIPMIPSSISLFSADNADLFWFESHHFGPFQCD